MSIQLFAIVGDTLCYELDLTPEILDRDPSSPDIGFKSVEVLVHAIQPLINAFEALVDFVESLRGFFPKLLDLLPSLLEAPLNRGEPLVEVVEEILVHGLVFPVPATLSQKKAEGNA